METTDYPYLDGFYVNKFHTVLGVDYVSMENSDGVRLELSEEGVNALDESPQITSQLVRVAEFIAEHGGYKDPRAVREVEPGLAFRVSSEIPDYHGGLHFASVYHPEATPEVIIKAYDLDRASAPLQFFYGSLVHKKLRYSDEPKIYSPKQYALFSSRSSGHRTVVMEYFPGETLIAAGSQIVLNHGYDEEKEAVDKVILFVASEIGRLLGKQGLRMTNDLSSNIGNLLIDDISGVNPDNILARKFAIIDQPKKTRRALALFNLMKIQSQFAKNPLAGTSIDRAREPLLDTALQQPQPF